MLRPTQWLMQGVLYALFALIVGVFSAWPTYSPLAPDHALVKLSFTHHGKLVAECRKRTPEELAKLAPNMRAAMDCKRERSPVRVEIDIDGKPVFQHLAQASGLSKDGASTVYHRFELAAGAHRISVRLNDDARQPGFAFQREETLTLAAGRVLVIDFNAEKGGVTFQ